MAKVLIVDDSLIITSILKRFFEEEGHTVVSTASTARKAISLYQEHEPDLVTMDIAMPGMSGKEALREILELNLSARVLMISANKAPSEIMECLKLGAMGFIEKPFDLNSPQGREEVKKQVEMALNTQVNPQVKKTSRPVAQEQNLDFVIDQFVEAVFSIFERMLKIKVEKTAHHKDDHCGTKFALSSVMGLSGYRAALVSISLPQDTAYRFSQAIVGDSKIEITDALVISSACELINIISGEALACLEKENVKFYSSVPAVVKGQDHQVLCEEGYIHQTLDFKVEDNLRFVIQFAFEEN